MKFRQNIFVPHDNIEKNFCTLEFCIFAKNLAFGQILDKKVKIVYIHSL